MRCECRREWRKRRFKEGCCGRRWGVSAPLGTLRCRPPRASDSRPGLRSGARRVNSARPHVHGGQQGARASGRSVGNGGRADATPEVKGDSRLSGGDRVCGAAVRGGPWRHLHQCESHRWRAEDGQRCAPHRWRPALAEPASKRRKKRVGGVATVRAEKAVAEGLSSSDRLTISRLWGWSEASEGCVRGCVCMADAERARAIVSLDSNARDLVFLLAEFQVREK